MRRRWVVTGAACAGALLLAMGTAPRYVEELRVGGGYGEPVDGGADFDGAGNAWLDGSVTAMGLTSGADGVTTDLDGAGGALTMRFENSSGTVMPFAEVRASAEDVTAGDEDGSLALWAVSKGVDTEYVRIDADAHKIYARAPIVAGFDEVQLTSPGGPLQLAALEQGGALTGYVMTWDGAAWSAGEPAERTIALMAAEGAPASTGGCGAAEQRETASHGVNAWTLPFDGASDEAAWWSLALPDDYAGGSLSARVFWTATGGASGDTVAFELEALCLGEGDALDSAPGTACVLTDAWVADEEVHVTAAGSLTIADAAAGELCLARLRRDASGGAMAADADVLMVTLEYAPVVAQ
jgi:hypothetical protein